MRLKLVPKNTSWDFFKVKIMDRDINRFGYSILTFIFYSKPKFWDRFSGWYKY